MGRAGIEQLLYQMDEAFQGHGEHALLNNLKSLRDDDWYALPEVAGRTIFDIVQHVGESRFAYENHAFGDGSMRWDQPGTVPTIERETTRDAVVDWLRDGFRTFRESIAALEDDGELLAKRMANWGEEYETRWLIGVMIQHDLYHAGEINHTRALLHGNDRWPWG